MQSIGGANFEMQYVLSPITLVSGWAAARPGGSLPIIALTEPSFNQTMLVNPQGVTDTDEFFAHFSPLPGATLIDNQIGMYPFANQQVAANAVVVQPLQVSLLMTAPARGPGGYPNKLGVMSGLQSVLYMHSISGGRYHVNTPAMLYTDMVLTRLADVTRGDTRQAQMQWQWDFVKPLITQLSAFEAQQNQNTLLNRLSNGLQTNGAQSGPDTVPVGVGTGSGTNVYNIVPADRAATGQMGPA